MAATDPTEGSPAYLAGLMLAGRDVLVVGAGAVATRRVPRLVQAGARVRVVAPMITEELRTEAAAGRVTWAEREFADDDLDGAWYVLALTDRPEVNARVAELAEARRIFCVRGDQADRGTAWTPAVADLDGMSIGVLGNREPHRSRAVRDRVLRTLGSRIDLVPGTLTLEPGTVTLVGGGPGDPGLITTAGLAAIRAAEVIVHDRLGPLELLAEARPDAEILPVGKIPHGAFTPQEEINRLLVDRARRGLRVVRLKGGDNFVFGRGGEEWQECAAAGVPVRVIPGVTSAVAVPALAGVPVTHRSVAQGFVVVSGHVAPGDPRSDVDWAAVAGSGLTVVVLMGVQNLAAIAEALLAGGLGPATPVAVVAEGSTAQQQVLRSRLEAVGAAAREVDIRPPAIVVVGEVAGLDLDRDRD